MKKQIILSLFFVFVFMFASLHQLKADKLVTVDRKEYEGKMVAFKFNTVYFNVYKFGKMNRTRRFPLYEVWKVEFNSPREGLESSFEMESNYKKLRRGKRVKKLTLNSDQKWLDTGITLKIGKEILFSASGSIYINKETQVYQNGELTLTMNNKKSLPNQPTGAIIARVGKRGEPFYVGDDKAPFQITQKGNLYIGVNDFDFSDNSGQFTVTIYY
ncbi:MAG: hypothetical protein GY950_10665 [bacterium]|nr:hypothetical protein [bacterium]